MEHTIEEPPSQEPPVDASVYCSSSGGVPFFQVPDYILSDNSSTSNVSQSFATQFKGITLGMWNSKTFSVVLLEGLVKLSFLTYNIYTKIINQGFFYRIKVKFDLISILSW